MMCHIAHSAIYYTNDNGANSVNPYKGIATREYQIFP